MKRNENSPTVSVIIPTYNRAHLVVRAIRSVLNQSFQDFEIIVVDDGSTDNTEEVINNFNDSRIRYIRHEKNRGVSAARNTGILAARGEYIAFLDSDDEWLPQKLEKQVKAFKTLEEKVGLIYTGICFVDPSGRPLGERRSTFSGYVFHELLKRNIIGTASSVMLRRKCLISTGLFDEALPFREDYDLWIRIAKNFEIFAIPEVLTRHYIHKQPRLSANLEAKIKGHELFIAKFENYLNNNPKALAWQLYRLAKLYMSKRELTTARNLLRQSFNKWPYPKVMLKWLFLSVTLMISNLTKNLKKQFKSRLN